MELIIWKCFGKDGLKQFNQELGDRRVEKFWTRDSTGSYKVHPVVESCIRKTRDRIRKMDFAEPRHGTFFSSLLDQVENGMLRIEIIPNTAGDTTNCRETALGIFQKLLTDLERWWDVKG